MKLRWPIVVVLAPLSGWAAGSSTNQYSAKSGVAEAIGLVEALGKTWADEGREPFGVGDLSLPDGAPLSTHFATGDHTTGTGVDLRPVRKDGAPQGVSWRDPAYDREATQKLVDSARKLPQVDRIIFNDPEIKGVQFYPGHDDHLHIRVKKVFGNK